MKSAATAEVMVVGAFGRGVWLTSELRLKGCQVTFVDLSEALGRWSPEDWEGPFGVLRHSSLTESQISRLQEDEFQEPIDRGYTFWSNRGPVDMQGLLSLHQESQLAELHSLRQYLESWEKLTQAKQTRAADAILSEAFQKTWLCHLSHQLASTTYIPNHLGTSDGIPLPLRSEFSLRRVTRRGFQQVLQRLRERGAEVLEGRRLQDVMTEKNMMTGLEVEGEWSGSLKAPYCIWLLSGEETQHLSEKAAARLFPKGHIEPQWVWQRSRVQLESLPYGDVIPPHMVMIGNENWPWANENLLVLQRNMSSQDWDVWLRIPRLHRFQNSFIDEVLKRAAQVIQSRLPGVALTLLDKPAESMHSQVELGPSLWPVFTPEDRQRKLAGDFENLSFGGPDRWSRLDWVDRLGQERRTLEEFVSWRSKLKDKQGERIDRAIHAP